ncbi:cyclic nucleotide-binding domain-containing protein [Rhodohalobacter sp. 614A]|uniref:cyclic nucleotide-binding domain-containing protein n=1 Tax=Rhodohalobacter sp. 614A TaxID=2908649 RepID=UPI001F43313F|nr:cyclic nucleotide-binding domain-containing protein [Rhodohalobacter sp. 614A]
MFKKSDFKKMRNQGNIVFKSNLLKDLTPFERYELLQLCHRRKFKEGEFIYHQNDPGAGMYFIEEGTVRLIVSRNSELSDDEKFTLDIHAPSEIGIMAVGYEIPRMSTAQCITESTLLGFFKPDFETLKKRNPETAVKFLEAVSTQTMKRFEQSIDKLKECSDLKTAFSILFHEHQES